MRVENGSTALAYARRREREGVKPVLYGARRGHITPERPTAGAPQHDGGGECGYAESPPARAETVVNAPAARRPRGHEARRAARCSVLLLLCLHSLHGMHGDACAYM